MSLVSAETKDIFSVAVKYGEKIAINSSKGEDVVKVIDEGITLSEVINSRVDESVFIPEINDDVTEQPSEGKPSGNTSVNTNGDYSSYFANTKDYSNLNVSLKDSSLNKWSCVNRSYDKYDDQKEDNVTIIATAYTSAAEENGGWEGMNAINGKLGPGCIAAPKDIPFHTKIRISGLGVFNVEDRGGAIKRVSEDIIRIDVWMNSYNEAMKFGKRVYKGRIL